MEQRDFHATINIVTWNSEEYIEDLLKSLEAQTYLGFHIIVVDNGSSDNTLEIVQKFSNITIIKNSSNLGYARAHNKGIDMALKFWQGKDLENHFIFIVNPDIVFEKDCIEKILIGITRDAGTVVAGPKLLRIFYEELDNLPHKSKSNVIDSMGLEIYKSRKVVDRLSGEEEKADLHSEEVFGVSGAFMCLRASVLEKVRFGKEYFDEDFFAYKEDIDICWRIRNLGWDIKIFPEAVAYHFRKVRGDVKISWIQKLKNQKSKPKLIKFLSVRNHFWLMWKNDSFKSQLFNFPFIFMRETSKFLYMLCFDVTNIKAYFSAFGGLPKMLKKRAYLKNKKEDIDKWIK